MTNLFLRLLCCFTGVFAIWLAIMEIVLRHEGFPMRIVIAACILVQSLATLLVNRENATAALRTLVIAGAVAIAWLGVSATMRMAHAEHFEGFVVLLGVALVLQAGLTLIQFTRVNSLV